MEERAITNNRLPLILVGLLSTLALLGVILLSALDHDVPDILPYVLTTCVGAVAGAIVMQKPNE